MKKILALCLVVVLAATAVMGASMAYLTDTDEAVNVMTLGNVDIEQIEQERGEDGTLVDFTQDKPLYPVVGETAWDETGVKVNETEYKVFDGDLKNVVDKIVTVKNTGKSPAYVRTIIAFEAPEGFNDDLLHINYNADGITMSDWSYVKVGETRYVMTVFTYEAPLAAGNVSAPSLMQVFLDKETTNEDLELLGDTYDILVLSQAVQTQGFADAATALDTAFGKVADNAAEWFGGLQMPGEPAPENLKAEFNGTIYDNIYDAVAAANANGGGTITLKGSAKLDKPVEITSNITIKGEKALTTYTRADGYTGTMFTVKAGATLTTENIVLDGAGATATGNLIATEGNGSIVLNAGSVLQNNNGAHAVSLATRGGGTLTLNGAQIINNSSDSGAIWGGGHIIVNEGSKINNNSSTGSAGAIRMVSGQNLTMNGGEISNNTAAASGGAIYGYGASTYNFNGGKMNGNTAATGGAMYTGDSSTINMSGDFEMCNNTADDAGAMRLSNRTAFNMSGGKVSGNTSKNSPDWDGFYGWNPGVNISGGELVDDVTIQGGLTPTVGGSGITGVIHFALSTNHNTANLAADFGTIKFTVAEGSNFSAFNLKPASGYTYTAGDEAKLICMNEGYSTYWDTATSTFKIKAN